jgi:hypothetical protein
MKLYSSLKNSFFAKVVSKKTPIPKSEKKKLIQGEKKLPPHNFTSRNICTEMPLKFKFAAHPFVFEHVHLFLVSSFSSTCVQDTT